jgi:hypothetical protein
MHTIQLKKITRHSRSREQTTKNQKEKNWW